MPKSPHRPEPEHGQLTRRRLLQTLAAGLASPLFTTGLRAQQTQPDAIGPFPSSILPNGIRSRILGNINGMRMHVLEAGFETPGAPAVLMLHGFPELAYSWRKVMLPVAAAGFHVIAPDLRGYGRSGGTNVTFDDDLRPFGTLNRISDVVALTSAFGYRNVTAVVGHDQGSPLAGWCALTRPDIFRSVVMMSAPFGGPPTLPFDTAPAQTPPATAGDPDRIYNELAQLNPPRKHYQRYYQTREANANMWHPPQGIHAFLRAYYHMKSADWAGNDPHPLAARTAAEWAKLPRYYVMDLNKGMAEQVAAEMPSAAQIAANRWLPEKEMQVYAEEYGRTGFQGGLQGYRSGQTDRETQLFSGRKIDVPAMFIGGKKDWGVYQNPGAVERLQTLCTKMQGTHLIDGAGHWVQQEQPAAVSELVLQFLRST